VFEAELTLEKGLHMPPLVVLMRSVIFDRFSLFSGHHKSTVLSTLLEFVCDLEIKEGM
jgi:hypothetical protein